MGRSHAVAVRLHIGESATGGEIKQHAIGGIAGAPARFASQLLPVWQLPLKVQMLAVVPVLMAE